MINENNPIVFTFNFTKFQRSLFSILSLLTCFVATLKRLKILVIYTFKEKCYKELLPILLGNSDKTPQILWEYLRVSKLLDE